MAREKDLEKEVDGDAQSDGASGRAGSMTLVRPTFLLFNPQHLLQPRQVLRT